MIRPVTVQVHALFLMSTGLHFCPDRDIIQASGSEAQGDRMPYSLELEKKIDSLTMARGSASGLHSELRISSWRDWINYSSG